MKLKNQLELDRCPHCQVDKPSLLTQWSTRTEAHSGGHERTWNVYKCARCGGLITAGSRHSDLTVSEMYPYSQSVNDAVPEKAKDYLKQSISSIHAPAGAVMLAASAVDSMLKEKGYKNGSLYSRVDQALKDHLITGDMAKWAHEVRLDANDQRHADDNASMPTTNDATKVIAFAKALAEFIFVLPSRVTRGLKESKKSAAKKVGA
jgi:hypothetical protein